MSVYFIRAIGGFGPVKIGHSHNPASRLHALMTYAPYPLEVVAEADGDHRLERQFHMLFREQHSHREWFHPSASLERTIEQVRAGTFDFACLPAGKLLPSAGRTGWSDAQRWALSLSARLRHRCENHGIRTPAEMRDRLYQFDKMSEDERVSLAAEIEAHIADPMVRGIVIDAAWARKRVAAYLEKREAA